MTKPKACEGGETKSINRMGVDFEFCAYCGNSVRWDLIDDLFFGWQNCDLKADDPKEKKDE